MALDIIFNPCSDAEYPGATAAYVGAAVDVKPVGGWNAGPDNVLVWATTAGYFAVGVTATASSTPIPANTPTYLKVPSGTKDGWRVSFFPITATGNAYAKPGNRN